MQASRRGGHGVRKAGFVFGGLAEVADEFDYARPTVNETSLLRIKNGRHAVLEKIGRESNKSSSLSTLDSPLSTDTWLLTDAGFNILLSMETYKWYYHLISAERPSEPHDTEYKLAGPLCDGGDVYFDIEGENRLPEYRLLPANIPPNAVLAMLNCGAYSLAQASQYNGRFLPAVVLVKANGDAELVRKRDSFEDLINNDL